MTMTTPEHGGAAEPRPIIPALAPFYGVARELLHSLRARRRTAARLIGVALSGLATNPEPPQLALFVDATESLETERDRAVARTVDSVRRKFGQDAIGSAQLSKHDDES